MEYLMVDKKQAADSYGLLKMEINDLLLQKHLPAKYNVPLLSLSDRIEEEM